MANADPNICEIAKFYDLMITVALPYPCTIARLTCNMMRNIRVPNVLILQLCALRLHLLKPKSNILPSTKKFSVEC